MTEVSQATEILRSREELIAKNKELTKRLEQAHEELRVMRTKLEVATEVTRCFPGLWRKILWALDMSDDWWMSNKHATIEMWAARIERLEDATVYPSKRRG